MKAVNVRMRNRHVPTQRLKFACPVGLHGGAKVRCWLYLPSLLASERNNLLQRAAEGVEAFVDNAVPNPLAIALTGDETGFGQDF